MLNILLAEDHNIVRNGIKMLLEADEEINVVGEAFDGKQALEIVKSDLEIDIVLTDINMPEMDGIALIKEIKQIKPHIHVVVLSMHDNEKYIIQAFAEGAMGYILKNVNADELVFSLKFIANGGRYLCSELTMKIVEKMLDSKQLQLENHLPNIDFSLREIEILQLIAEGYTNHEMSEKLFLSKRTIEGHRQSLIDKTNSKNTAALIKFAVRNGFIK
ncbi:response regulator transcription factor [Pedobacter boryungensis]|uniref:Response regulator transcription factor n=1 Tax=Pedobacter boryungensis TaxID=869962 RepID=A0ABX2DG14_9SPHI|nr:response regulator transcription factor [Pedobacter boryungensis]NQX32967.1 response regulator transcription factor [Pedobacter boryungensis]